MRKIIFRSYLALHPWPVAVEANVYPNQRPPLLRRKPARLRWTDSVVAIAVECR
jgi:hypothetical protein